MGSGHGGLKLTDIHPEFDELKVGTKVKANFGGGSPQVSMDSCVDRYVVVQFSESISGLLMGYGMAIRGCVVICALMFLFFFVVCPKTENKSLLDYQHQNDSKKIMFVWRF